MKLIYAFISALVITSFAGCKQDFDITADYQEIPVVYGLLNQQDAVHYIRIQKGYLIDGDARLATGITDSIYYPDVLTVSLVGYNAQGAKVDSFTFERVDGNDPSIGLVKDSGLFANSPAWLYRSSRPLLDTRTYRLVVTNTSNGYTFKSKTIDNSDIKLIKDFAVNFPNYGSRLNLVNNNAQNINWNDAENAAIYDVTIRFFYTEYRASDNSFYKNDSIDVPYFRSFAPDLTSSANNRIEFTSDAFLTYLAAHITSDIEVVREFNVNKGMQFRFACGGNELYKYIDSRQAQGGLSANEALSPYTNIDGGVGLISSRYFKQVDSVLLSPLGLDTLACSSITRGLRFKKSNGVICQ
ncbi:MAG TPA: hypothetical protein VK154_05915 [Chitinophagales bacterium]|nr:hypothetical protein [Chitinophagales bacterium]